MKVSCIQAQRDLARRGIGEIKFAGAHGVAFHSNPEQLTFNGIDVPFFGNVRREDRIQRVLQTFTRCKAIRRGVLITIWNPDIVHHRIVQLFTNRGADLSTRDAVIDPELTNARILMAQRKAIFRLGMAEAGGVKIDTELLCLGPIDPAAKIIDGELVALWQWRAVRRIASMQIEAQWARNVRGGLLKIGH